MRLSTLGAGPEKEDPRRTATRSWRQCFTQSQLRPQTMLGCLDMR
jgi:hypothetical protein